MIFFQQSLLFYESVNFDSYVHILKCFWQKELAFDVSSMYNVDMPQDWGILSHTWVQYIIGFQKI